MQRQPAPAEIAGMILSAPAWVRLALAVRDEGLRRRAADALAEWIAAASEGRAEPAERQLALPIGR